MEKDPLEDYGVVTEITSLEAWVFVLVFLGCVFLYFIYLHC
jgi:hypothetical protein